MKKIAKSLAQRFLPNSLFTRLHSMHSRNHQVKYLKSIGALSLSKKFVAANGSKVLNGPFKGMAYAEGALQDRLVISHLLGSYEEELHPIFSNLDAAFELFVDVGAAEGYYAVGLALVTAGSPVYAFETDPRERAHVEQMAALNGVSDRVVVRSWCSADALASLVDGKRGFVLSDCEGFEFDLFTPEVVTALRHSDVVVEIHERKPDVSMTEMHQLVKQRFQETHLLETIRVTARDAERYPQIKSIGPDGLAFLVDHRRPDQVWLHARAKA